MLELYGRLGDWFGHFTSPDGVPRTMTSWKRVLNGRGLIHDDFTYRSYPMVMQHNQEHSRHFRLLESDVLMAARLRSDLPPDTYSISTASNLRAVNVGDQ
jgi:hypothetical protein